MAEFPYVSTCLASYSEQHILAVNLKDVKIENLALAHYALDIIADLMRGRAARLVDIYHSEPEIFLYLPLLWSAAVFCRAHRFLLYLHRTLYLEKGEQGFRR